MTRKKADHEKKKRGRPTVYNAAFHPRKAAQLALMGLTDVQMAIVFDINERTLNRWKIRYPAFFQSIKQSKDLVDRTVENSLFKRALGMETTQKKIVEYPDGTTRKTIAVKYIPPSLSAIIFWLTNRRPDLWKRGGRDVPEVAPGVQEGSVRIRNMDAFIATLRNGEEPKGFRKFLAYVKKAQKSGSARKVPLKENTS
jgi:hypothetical protein